MKRAIVWAILICLAAAALVAIGVRLPAVQDRLVDAAIQRMVARQANELFEKDSLRALACGTGSPLPHPTRAAACVAVFAGGRFWVVDTGPRSWNRLALLRIDGDGFDLWNLNKLLPVYPGADGVKPGFTDAAGRCLVGSAVRDNHRVIVTVLNSADTTGDSRALLDYAFEGFRWPS